MIRPIPYPVLSRVLYLVLPLLVVAMMAPQIIGATEDSLPIENYVRPDGSIDMEGLRQAGSGTVDLGGRGVLWDPTSNQARLYAPERGGRAPGDEYWYEGFGSPGLDEEVHALAVFEGKLIFTGVFTSVGDGFLVNHIAAWDGLTWSSLGGGLNGTGKCLHIHEGDLYVGGWFNQAGDIPANYVARWDGSAWHAVGVGFNWAVYTMATYEGNLIAGGQFANSGGQPTNRLARWTGSSWEEFGGGANATVASLFVDGSDLLAGGYFTQLGSVTVNQAARWNGGAWEAMGSWTGYGGPTSFLEFDGAIHAAGHGRVQRWSGTDWVNLEWPSGDFPSTLKIYQDQLMVCGKWEECAYSWDGAVWTVVGNGLGVAEPRAAAVYEGEYYVAGRIFGAGDIGVLNAARWNGASWGSVGAPAVGQGIHGKVYALCVYQGDLIAGGEFERAGGTSAQGIARWDGESWHPLGNGVYGWSGTVHALLVHEGELIVGGQFDYAGDGPAYSIARWDGESWSTFSGRISDSVLALTTHQGDLVVGGGFTSIDGSTVNRIARWDGFEWQSLGDGLESCEVRGITTYGNALVACGCFDSAGGVETPGVALWDGVSWNPLGEGLGTNIRAVTVYGDQLIAGGSFNIGVASHVARWDGNNWGPVGAGLGDYVEALHTMGNDLFATGTFSQANGLSASCIARYDGYQWEPLGSGIRNRGLALTVHDDGQGTHLYVGGVISGCGEGLLSSGIGSLAQRPVIPPDDAQRE